jgi:hypothetical protein
VSEEQTPNWWKADTRCLSGGANISNRHHNLILWDSRGGGLEIYRKLGLDGGVFWLIYWHMNFGFTPPFEEQRRTHGSFCLPESGLRAMFDLTNGDPAGSVKALEQRFGADVVIPGRYIRKGPYLNIPGPGTGEHDDANLSIWIDDEVRLCVARLITTPSQMPD